MKWAGESPHFGDKKGDRRIIFFEFLLDKTRKISHINRQEKEKCRLII